MTLHQPLASGHAVGKRRVPSTWISRRPRLSPDQLPVRVDLSPSRLGALILCIIGAVWLSLSWGLVVELMRDADPALAVFGALPLIGIGHIAWGIVQMYQRRSVLFGKNGVEVTERKLRGSRVWTAAYGDYLGVLQREHTVRRKQGSTTYQIIQLVHADPAADFPLYVVCGDAPPRERWEALAEHLGLPALQLDDDRIVVRATGTLNASLAEQLRIEQPTGSGPSDPPPPAIEVRSEGRGDDEAFWLELKGSRVPAWGYALFAALPMAFMTVAFMQHDGWPQAAFGLPFMAGIAWIRWKDSTSPRAIRVTRERVENLDTWRWSTGDPVVLANSDIENVRVHRSRKAGGFVLAVESDHGTMHLGQGLSRTELAWLRDFLSSAIATA